MHYLWNGFTKCFCNHIHAVWCVLHTAFWSANIFQLYLDCLDLAFDVFSFPKYIVRNYRSYVSYTQPTWSVKSWKLHHIFDILCPWINWLSLLLFCVYFLMRYTENTIFPCLRRDHIIVNNVVSRSILITHVLVLWCSLKPSVLVLTTLEKLSDQCEKQLHNWMTASLLEVSEIAVTLRSKYSSKIHT